MPAIPRQVRRQQQRFSNESEPNHRDSKQVVECGGELYWAVDFTSAGFPIGLRLSEMEAMQEHDAREGNVGWVIAKDALRQSFGPEADIGRVTKIGEGMAHETFAAQIELYPDERGTSGTYTVELPSRRAGVNHPPMSDLQTLLHRVSTQTDAIRVPTVIASISTVRGMAVVRPYFDGIPMDLRAGRQPCVKPHEIIAQVASVIHAVDVAGLELSGHRTRRAHAEAEIATAFGLPELEAAEAWAHEHLPADEPASLVHGDLLGQNILLHPTQPPAVIDWEFTGLGDPAYDLAVVTRGKPKPFDMIEGFQRLLEAYSAAGGANIAPSDVRLYELCLVARWYKETVLEEGPLSASHVLGNLRNVLKHAVQAAS